MSNESSKLSPSPQTPQPWKRTLLTVAKVVAVVALIVAAYVVGSAGGDTPAPHGGATKAEAEVWTCSMHPQIQHPEPGTCPICGMDLIPLTSSEASGDSPTTITLTERARALARIRTTPVMRRSRQELELRLLGRVDVAETSRRSVVAWTGGRIDRLHIKTTGETIRRGQIIASLYSPEVYTAHADLLIARRARDRLGDESPAARGAQRSLDAARSKLRLLGVGVEQLRRMEAAEQPWRNISIASPHAGTIVSRLVNEGDYVKTGQGLYDVADLGQLWVQLDAYETDIQFLSLEQPVELHLSAFPGETFRGRVSFVEPRVSLSTRTTQVRVEVDSHGGRLKPGMFAEAVVRVSYGEDEPALVIPDSAPLFSGRRSVVYVAVPNTDQPTYEVREVRLGPKLADSYPVVAGLVEGEQVVVNGAFKLDADLQIRGGKSLMARADDRLPGLYEEALVLDPDELAKLAPAAESYLHIAAALANDDIDASRKAASELRNRLDVELAGHDADWRPLAELLDRRAETVALARAPASSRTAFFALTEVFVAMLRRFGNPTDRTLYQAYCPMAFDNRGASWIQSAKPIRNPWYGAEMLECGEIWQELAPDAHLPARPDPDRPTSEPDSGPSSLPGPAGRPASGPATSAATTRPATTTATQPADASASKPVGGR